MEQAGSNPSPGSWSIQGWALACVIPGTFFAFEAISITTYPALQAPNVSVIQQIAMMGAFFGLWTFVPRIAWPFIPSESLRKAPHEWRRALIVLAALGFVLASVHLFLLTALLRAMHAPAGGQIGDFLYSFGEVMFGHAPIWMLAFFAAVAVSAFFKARIQPLESGPSRIEVRDRGHIRLIETRQIECVQASGNYVEYHTDVGKILARQSLRSLDQTLSEAGFVASHRSAMVNPIHIASIRTGGKGEGHRVVFKSGSEAPLSRRNIRLVREKTLGLRAAE